MKDIFKASYRIRALSEKVWKDKDLKEVSIWISAAFMRTIVGHAMIYLFFVMIWRGFWAYALWVFSLSISAIYLLSGIATLWFPLTIVKSIWQLTSTWSRWYHLLFTHVLWILLPSALVLWAILLLLAPFLAVTIFSESILILPLQVVWLLLPVLVVLFINIEFLRWCKSIWQSEFLRKAAPRIIGCIILFMIWYIKGSHLLLPVRSYLWWVVVACGMSVVWVRKVIKQRDSSSRWKPLIQFSSSQLIKTAFPMLISWMSYTIMEHTDRLMLWGMTWLTDVGIYETALKLSFLISFMINVISTIFWPKLAEHYHNNDRKGTISLIRVCSACILICWWWAALLLLLFPEFFLWLFGAEFISWKHVLYILIAGQLINAVGWINGIYLNITGWEHVLKRIAFFTATLNILLNRILIQYIWISGAAIATGISLLIWNSIAIAYIYRRDWLLIFFVPRVRRNKHEPAP